VNTGATCNLLWVKLFPFLRWLGQVDRTTLKADLFAGLTNAVIVLPQGVAFAMIAGLPPEYGLYTAMVTPIIAALFGSSRHLISGPTTAISIVVFSSLNGLAEPGSPEFVQLALTLTFLAGVYQFGFGLARLGQLVNFVSHSVVVGFTAGAAILIATGQLKHALGIEIPRGESFLHTWMDVFDQLGTINPYALGVALVTLAVAIALRMWRPSWPGLLLAMIAGSLIAALFASAGAVQLVGSLPTHLPPPSVPDLSLTTIKQLASGAFAVALLGLIEAVSIARAVATRSQQRIDADQEFIGQGLSNLAGSFFSAYAGSGSFTRTGLNYESGARTPLSAVFAALFLAAILLFVAPLSAYLPIPAMGGVILLVAFRLIDLHHIREILRSSRGDSAVLVATFLATLFVELEFAIYAGVMLSLVLYLNRTAKPRIVGLAPDPNLPKRAFVPNANLLECPQLKVMRIDGSLFFGAVNHVSAHIFQHLERNPNQNHILLLGDGINFIDVAGAEMLAQIARQLRANGGALYLCKIKEGVCNILRKGSYLEAIDQENVFASKSDAIGPIISRMSAQCCADCERGIFVECAGVMQRRQELAA
jgi:SulP family sulfate permease